MDKISDMTIYYYKDNYFPSLQVKSKKPLVCQVLSLYQRLSTERSLPNCPAYRHQSPQQASSVLYITPAFLRWTSPALSHLCPVYPTGDTQQCRRTILIEVRAETETGIYLGQARDAFKYPQYTGCPPPTQSQSHPDQMSIVLRVRNPS